MASEHGQRWGRLARVALGLAVVVAAACGDGDAASDGSEAGSGSAGSEPSSAPTASPSTPLPPEAEPPESTPEASAQQLVDAWSAGDPEAAAAVAAPEVVQALFGSGLDPSVVLFRGCREEPELECTALLPGSRQITMVMGGSAPPMVMSIELPPDAP